VDHRRSDHSLTRAARQPARCNMCGSSKSSANFTFRLLHIFSRCKPECRGLRIPPVTVCVIIHDCLRPQILISAKLRQVHTCPFKHVYLCKIERRSSRACIDEGSRSRLEITLLFTNLTRQSDMPHRRCDAALAVLLVSIMTLVMLVILRPGGAPCIALQRQSAPRQ
jgi:hypothetical protein